MSDLTDEAVEALLDAAVAVGDDKTSDLARALLAARADAKAAVAVVVEKAAEIGEDAITVAWLKGRAIRALAPEDAIAEVTEWKRLAIAGNLIALEMRNMEAERDRLANELAAANAREAGLRKAVEALCAVLDRNDKKGPIPDVEMMFCWLAAQGVRVAFRSDGLSYMQKGKTT